MSHYQKINKQIIELVDQLIILQSEMKNNLLYFEEQKQNNVIKFISDTEEILKQAEIILEKFNAYQIPEISDYRFLLNKNFKITSLVKELIQAEYKETIEI